MSGHQASLKLQDRQAKAVIRVRVKIDTSQFSLINLLYS